MKAPPKRKGNIPAGKTYTEIYTLNESPSEKEGKSRRILTIRQDKLTLNESPSEKEGKCVHGRAQRGEAGPSMKAPPKRKGNPRSTHTPRGDIYPQ